MLCKRCMAVMGQVLHMNREKMVNLQLGDIMNVKSVMIRFIPKNLIFRNV